ncbi:LysR substrate-binding domain-containing protein [Halomonas salipaludis]|uniref:Transcriptional regulator LrhA n=1 Tax=Halomonas salipaludis TaxID=2032625 RepID=A0A2A2EWV5_9GAMM|nr:LysR substrate-binding domain-containing protein [Halomonas salipaludis]PAU77148.1 transcriptional regulator LrhA [Halomonas salipaludis]
MRHLDLSLLRTFVAICDETSFAKAAHKVHKSQPAISQQMGRLESELQVALFVKRGRQKQLTAAGIRLEEYARRLLALHDELWATLHDEELSGPVRIGAPADIADTVLPGILQSFARANPRLSMAIHVGRSPDLMDMLFAGELDLTISTREAPDFPHIVLRNSPVVWIAASDYQFDKLGPLPLVLADEPSIFRRIALEALQEHGQSYKESYISPNLAGIKSAVRAGLGITARSIEVVTPEFRVLSERQGLPPLPNVNFYLYLRDDNPSEAATKLYQLLASQVGGAASPAPSPALGDAAG